MGRLIGWLSDRGPEGPRGQLVWGIGVAAVPAGAAATAGLAARAIPFPLARVVATIWLLKTAFSLRALLDRTRAVDADLARGGVDDARDALRDLVSRDRSDLDAEHIASAAIESVAENLTDSYVAPLIFYWLGGLPLALAYRAVNTADAMVGYHGRHEHLGKASARIDDVLSYAPARVAAGALVAAAPLVGLDAPRALAALVRDRAKTESPNAGWTMAAAAGALGVWLEKAGHHRVGGGRAPTAGDVAKARDLVLAAACVATVAVALARR